MKIQCDVSENAPAAVICCADEAAFCATCDMQVHEANKLVSKHKRLCLQSVLKKLPLCDICQKEAIRFGDLEWIADIDFLHEQVTQEVLTAWKSPNFPPHKPMMQSFMC